MIDAALETLKEAGIIGTSARAIAQRGGFSQAAIFYHFGSVNDLLVAAVQRLSEARIAQYRERVEQVRSLPELVQLATALHAEDDQEGHITVLAQMLAGSSGSDEVRASLLSLFTPWMRLVQDAVERLTEPTPYAGAVPARDLAFGVVALFIGIELLSHLDGGAERAESLFESLQMAGLLLGGLLGGDDEPLGGLLQPRQPPTS